MAESITFPAQVRRGSLATDFEGRPYVVLSLHAPAGKVDSNELVGKLSKDKAVDVTLSWANWQLEMPMEAGGTEKPKRQPRQKPAAEPIPPAPSAAPGHLVTCKVLDAAHSCTADCDEPRLLPEADEAYQASIAQGYLGTLTTCRDLALPHVDKPDVCIDALHWGADQLDEADREHERQVRINAEAAALSSELDDLEQREQAREAAMPGETTAIACCPDCLKAQHDGPCVVEPEAPVPTPRQRKRTARAQEPAAARTADLNARPAGVCTCGDPGTLHYRTIGDTKNGITQDGCMRDGCGCLRFELDPNAGAEPSSNGHRPEKCALCDHPEAVHTNGLNGGCRQAGCGCMSFRTEAIDAPKEPVHA